MEPTKEKGKRGKRVRKKRVKYNVLFVPDEATVDVKKFSMRLNFLTTLATVVILIIALLIIYCYYLSNHIVVLTSAVNTQKQQALALNEEITKLEDENAQLQEKIVILSDTINEKTQAEEERNAQIQKEYMPTGFPMSGTASFAEETENQDKYQVNFLGGEGTNVIAAAKGVVLSISGNSTEGFIVTIDHLNGYTSVYMNGSEPKIKEGDEVTKDTVIFTMDANHDTLGYQIMLEGQSIDPMNIMEVYG